MPEIRKPFTLHKDHAIVHTASIDVKVLRINKRQMTMGVFRQLEEAPILYVNGEGTYSTRGIVWGRVRYTWSDSPAWTDQYVIWQRGDILCRCPLPTPGYLTVRVTQRNNILRSGRGCCGYPEVTLTGKHLVEVLGRLGAEHSDILSFRGYNSHRNSEDTWKDAKATYELFKAATLLVDEQIETISKLDQLFIAV